MALADILVILVDHRVDFVVVGGMAAVLRGAPVTTRDIDIVYDRTAANIGRLLAALTALDARFRGDERRPRPNEGHLWSLGHKLLETRHGPLDVLGSIEEQTTYADLLPHASPLEVAGVTVLVLSVERLIEVKRKLARPKDQLMLLELEALLEELARDPRR
jgi:hypothetical protein